MLKEPQYQCQDKEISIFDCKFLNTIQIINFLQQIEKICDETNIFSKDILKNPQLPKTPPKSGFYTIYPTSFQNWRKDGHCYQKRKSKQFSVQENQTRLKHDGQDVVVCSYCVGSGSQDDNLFFTPKTFKRRAYWLINDPRFVFVHYLDEEIAQSQILKYQHQINQIESQFNQLIQVNVFQKEPQGKIKADDQKNISQMYSFVDLQTQSCSSEQNVNRQLVNENSLLHNNSFANIQKSPDFQEQQNLFVKNLNEQSLESQIIFTSNKSMNFKDNEDSEIQSQVYPLRYHQNFDIRNNEYSLNQEINCQKINNSQVDFTKKSQNLDYKFQNGFNKDKNYQFHHQLSYNQNYQNDQINQNYNQLFDYTNANNQFHQQLNFPQCNQNQPLINFQCCNFNSPNNNQIIQMDHFQIQQLQKQIQDNIMNNLFQNQSQFFQNFQQTIFNKEFLQILDFSPDWDFIEGGSKIMFCLNTPGVLQVQDQQKIMIAFGDIEKRVPVKFIQSSVFNCICPSSVMPGFVKIFLIYDGQIVNNLIQSQNEKKFEYRLPADQQIVGKKRFKNSVNEGQNQFDGCFNQSDEREYKVRIIDRLSQLEQKLNKGTQKDQECAPSEEDRNPQIEELFSKFKNDDESSIRIIDILEREFMLKNLQTILSRLQHQISGTELKELLNHIDQYGFALIHYFAKINYFEVIQLLKEHGADMNILTRDEKHSPLVIAAIHGHEMTVQALVRNSANFQNKSEVLNFDKELIQSDLQQNENQSIILKEQKNVDDDIDKQKNQAFEISFQQKNYKVAECILRDFSLNEAVNKDIKSDTLSENGLLNLSKLNHYRRRNSYQVNRDSKLEKDLVKTKNVCDDLESVRIKIKQKKFNEQKELVKIKLKYNIEEDQMVKIQKIQRRVREWLIKRQKFDIESASELLHSAFLSDKFKKRTSVNSFFESQGKSQTFEEKEAAILIQRTVRNWLLNHKE